MENMGAKDAISKDCTTKDTNDEELTTLKKQKRKKRNDPELNLPSSTEVSKTKTPYKGKPDHCYFWENKVDRRLKEEVFSRMRADKISLEAKIDPLICELGARYLKMHREKHFKILLEMRALETSITTFISALKPNFFEIFVEAAKRIAKYDAKQDVYLSPTFAINIATSLKQCCDIAITFIYTKNIPHYSLSNATIEAELKTLIRLFETNWCFEISSHAANTLNLNKWNKVTIVPLANDLRLLRQHLINLAKQCLEVLTKQVEDAKSNIELDDVDCQVTIKDSVAFNNLVETIYCRGCYPEKRGKGVPVLFHSDIQEHIDIILKIRNYFIPKNNPYLFATANSNAHLIGYKILSKHSKLCGAQNPSSITSTRLRKHLAPLSQLFNLSDGEIEQLATFMGHTPGVHRNSYRLPDDVYQTAKISKLLMGGANHYKGKSIDDIVIDMEENLLDENNCDDNSDEGENDIMDDLVNTSKASTSNCKALSPRSDAAKEFVAESKKKLTRKLVPWTIEQKQITLKYFKNHIKSQKPTKRQECDELKEKYIELLHNKDWLKIKDK
ncbi:unnamed protein product [Brassicogethes aeneus]|uniref:Uncharacterized protein n=1 Tax=Brassicogethes aeneus TaxID=1431903 RepID=A0A9P0BI16_BRAAE|nr:unnamed protein product [Brassicogethes aeneus]